MNLVRGNSVLFDDGACGPRTHADDILCCRVLIFFACERFGDGPVSDQPFLGEAVVVEILRKRCIYIEARFDLPDFGKEREVADKFNAIGKRPGLSLQLPQEHVAVLKSAMFAITQLPPGVPRQLPDRKLTWIQSPAAIQKAQALSGFEKIERCSAPGLW